MAVWGEETLPVVRSRRTGYGLWLVTVRRQDGAEVEGCGLFSAEEAAYNARLRAEKGEE